MRKVCLRVQDYNVLLDKLEQLGVTIRRVDDDGNPFPDEYHISRNCTRVIPTQQGLTVTILLYDNEYSLLPEVTGPDFLVDWTDEDTIDVEEEDGTITEAPLPWPEYDVERNTYDLDGNVTGTEIVKQPGGKISG